MISDGDGWASSETRRVPSASQAAGCAPLDVDLPRSPAASGLARHALRRWMAAQSLPGELVEDAALVVSETVTNAVMHACSAPRLCLSFAESRLRVEVHDTSRALPELRAPSTTGGGQGLRIIAAVADSCGWSTTSTGKVVWAELGVVASPRQRSEPTVTPL